VVMMPIGIIVIILIIGMIHTTTKVTKGNGIITKIIHKTVIMGTIINTLGKGLKIT